MKEKYPNENSLIEYYNETSEEFLKKFERDDDETRNDHTMLCKYVNGIYRVIEDYTEKYGDNFIYANL